MRIYDFIYRELDNAWNDRVGVILHSNMPSLPYPTHLLINFRLHESSNMTDEFQYFAEHTVDIVRDVLDYFGFDEVQLSVIYDMEMAWGNYFLAWTTTDLTYGYLRETSINNEEEGSPVLWSWLGLPSTRAFVALEGISDFLGIAIYE